MKGKTAIAILALAAVFLAGYLFSQHVASTDERPCVMAKLGVLFANSDRGPHKFEHCAGGELVIIDTLGEGGIAMRIHMSVVDLEGKPIRALDMSIKPEEEEVRVPCPRGCSTQLLGAW